MYFLFQDSLSAFEITTICGGSKNPESNTWIRTQESSSSLAQVHRTRTKNPLSDDEQKSKSKSVRLTSIQRERLDHCRHDCCLLETGATTGAAASQRERERREEGEGEEGGEREEREERETEGGFIPS